MSRQTTGAALKYSPPMLKQAACNEALRALPVPTRSLKEQDASGAFVQVQVGYMRIGSCLARISLLLY